MAKNKQQSPNLRMPVESYKTYLAEFRIRVRLSIFQVSFELLRDKCTLFL